jgi:hypothetical protein
MILIGLRFDYDFGVKIVSGDLGWPPWLPRCLQPSALC